MGVTDPSPSAAAPSRPAVGELWVLAALVVVAAAVRFASLHAASFWLDEAYSVVALRGSLGDVWHAVNTTESTPPLYYLLGWVWTQLFGTSEAGLRSLSALAGTALVPAVWLAGRELLDRRAALIAAALTATSPLLVWFSQEARAYSLAVLLCALAFWQLARARRRAPGALVWWAVFAALALSAHYITVFPLLAEAAVLLWWRRDRAAVLAVGAVGLAGLALLPLLVSQRDNPLAGYVHGTPVRQVAEIVKQFAVGYDGPWEALLATLGIALLVTGLALVPAAPARSRAAARLCLLVAVAAPAGLLLLLVAGQNQLLSRYLLPVLPLVLLVVAAGFAAPRAGRWGVAGAALLCAVGLTVTIGVAVTPSQRTREDWRGAADALSSPLRPRALVVFPASGTLPLSLYLRDVRTPVTPDLQVREIDFIDTELDRDHRRGDPFPATLPGNPLFRLAEQSRTSTAAVVRYVAPVPTTIPAVSILGAQAGGRQSAVLVQR